MKSTLFTALSTNEEANLSGGGYRSSKNFFSNNNTTIGNTAISVPVNVTLGNKGFNSNYQSSYASAGNIYD